MVLLVLFTAPQGGDLRASVGPTLGSAPLRSLRGFRRQGASPLSCHLSGGAWGASGATVDRCSGKPAAPSNTGQPTSAPTTSGSPNAPPEYGSASPRGRRRRSPTTGVRVGRRAQRRRVVRARTGLPETAAGVSLLTEGALNVRSSFRQNGRAMHGAWPLSRAWTPGRRGPPWRSPCSQEIAGGDHPATSRPGVACGTCVEQLDMVDDEDERPNPRQTASSRPDGGFPQTLVALRVKHSGKGGQPFAGCGDL